MSSEIRPTNDEAVNRFLEAVESMAMTSFDYHWDRESSVAEFRIALGGVRSNWDSLNLNFTDEKVLNQLRAGLLQSLVQTGDRLFYDQGSSEESVAVYDFALSLDPCFLPALKGAVGAYLQGDKVNPAKALPYALRLSEIDPSHARTVAYVESLIDKKP